MRYFFLIVMIIVPNLFLNAQVDSAGKFFTASDGTQIYYEIKGKGEPIVLIHGLWELARDGNDVPFITICWMPVTR
ncbi:MAG: hypothetical protein JWN76_3508 [Chitinophagaceae bacterium]|nr:hypothetical protein [Chitinophagaceae bacterium]